MGNGSGADSPNRRAVVTLQTEIVEGEVVRTDSSSNVFADLGLPILKSGP
jgi:hypothetical protein